MVPHEPEQDRVSFTVACRLPPAWDAPEHRQRIYGTFERFQIALACWNSRHAGVLLVSLRRLTAAAERRRLALLGVCDAQRCALGAGV